MGKPAIRMLRRIVCMIACVLLCLSMALTLAAGSVRIVLHADWFTQAASTDRFVDTLHQETLDFLQDECLFYGLPFDTLKQAVTRETVQTAAACFFPAVYTDWQTGEDTANIAFDATPLKGAIDRYFATLPLEERPLDATASGTISNEIAQGLSLVLRAGIGGMISKVGKAVYSVGALPYRVAELSIWPAVFTVILAVVFFLLCQGNRYSRLYHTAGSLFIGTSIIAVPIWLLVWYDLPSKIAVGQSALRVFLEEVLYGAFGRVCLLTTSTFIVTFGALVTATILLVKKQKTA